MVFIQVLADGAQRVQRSIVHKIRNSLKYVSHKHDKAVAAGLKLVYRASTKAAARAKLERFAQT